MMTIAGDCVDMNRKNCPHKSFLRNFTSPAIDAPCNWKTLFARSTPIIVSFISPSSPSCGLQHIILAHCDAVRGGRQPPHLLLSCPLFVGRVRLVGPTFARTLLGGTTTLIGDHFAE